MKSVEDDESVEDCMLITGRIIDQPATIACTRRRQGDTTKANRWALGE